MNKHLHQEMGPTQVTVKASVVKNRNEQKIQLTWSKVHNNYARFSKKKKVHMEH